jgi:hypothetical protein
MKNNKKQIPVNKMKIITFKIIIHLFSFVVDHLKEKLINHLVVFMLSQAQVGICNSESINFPILTAFYANKTYKTKCVSLFQH